MGKYIGTILRDTYRCEKVVLLEEIERLLLEEDTQEKLLQRVWNFGARDFPAGSIRQHFLEIKAIVERELSNKG